MPTLFPSPPLPSGTLYHPSFLSSPNLPPLSPKILYPRDTLHSPTVEHVCTTYRILYPSLIVALSHHYHPRTPRRLSPTICSQHSTPLDRTPSRPTLLQPRLPSLSLSLHTQNCCMFLVVRASRFVQHYVASLIRILFYTHIPHTHTPGPAEGWLFCNRQQLDLMTAMRNESNIPNRVYLKL